MVIQSAQGAPDKGSEKSCEPVIGLSYRNSTPCWPQVIQPPTGAPNIVYIVLDDVGFGQLGCFGGPIETANIDKLAATGLRYSNFHTAAMCSPTRACLLTGRNHHSAGIGLVTDIPTGYDGYNMNISHNIATLAEMLKANGFNTFAIGEWHLAPSSISSGAGPFDNCPRAGGSISIMDSWEDGPTSGTLTLPVTPRGGTSCNPRGVLSSYQRPG